MEPDHLIIASRSLTVTSSVLSQLEKDIGNHEPERGGFLFGSFEPLKVMFFWYDKEGSTSSVTYYPSNNATSILRMVENATGLQFLGVVHSHPGHMDYPSGSDVVAMNSLLDLNRELPFVIAPIISNYSGNSSLYNSKFQKLEIMNKKILSCYVKYRNEAVQSISGSVEIDNDIKSQTYSMGLVISKEISSIKFIRSHELFSYNSDCRYIYAKFDTTHDKQFVTVFNVSDISPTAYFFDYKTETLEPVEFPKIRQFVINFYNTGNGYCSMITYLLIIFLMFLLLLLLAFEIHNQGPTVDPGPISNATFVNETI